MSWFIKTLGVCMAALVINSNYFEASAEDSKTGYDVAGIQLGDTPETAMSKLLDAGYKQTSKKMWASFEQLVKVKQGSLSADAAKDAIIYVTYEKNDEEVAIDFRSYPHGDYVSRIVYSNKSPSATVEKIAPTAIKKYGEPKKRNSNYKLVWSDYDPSYAACGSLHPQAICVTLDGGGFGTTSQITLKGGPNSLIDIHREAEKLVNVPETTF